MTRFISVNLKFIITVLLSMHHCLFLCDVYADQSIIAPLADESLLLDSANFNNLTVVVGERGHILYSRDQQNWTQAQVNTRATLTAVYLLNEKTGWAVGHDAVILKTKDAARTWDVVFSAIEEEAPLLDIYFWDENNGIAIGAYGLVYTSNDSGETWQKSDLILQAGNKTNGNVEEDEYEEFYDFHLNHITHTNDGLLYIAAEAGHIFRSNDYGLSWKELPSEYHGSYFGLLAINENELLIYGLRGNLYQSLDSGETWSKIETNTNEMLTHAIVLSNDMILISGLAGVILVSHDNRNSFKKLELEHRYGISSLLETKNNNLLLTTDRGIQSIPLSRLKSK